MVSPFQLAREAHALGAEKYLDELLIWRELAYCYCNYREDYQTIETLPVWAVASLRQHESDARHELYSWELLARGKTSDRLWNACQRSLLKHGELHNNVRMTWGKRILDWTSDASDCLRKLIDLNHRYALDGRDPASYGGILWCLGQFDRPFQPEQPVIGTVRSRPTAEHGSRLDLAGFEKIVDRNYCAESPKIAMIGAGLGGSMCARTLVDHGLSVQVFEKSRGAGGRAATRRIEKELQFDHGAQYFTCKDARIAKYVESWIQDHVVAPWRGKIAAVHNGTITPETKSWDRFVGVPGMNAIGRRLMDSIPLQNQTRVQKVVQEGDQYRLFAEADAASLHSQQLRDLGLFDCVLWNCPPEQTAPLVPENCSWLAEAKKAEMRPTWTLMVAFSTRWGTPFDGAFINDKGPLRWLARNTSKPGRPRDLDCWTIHADSDWSADHLTLAGDEIAEILLEELAKTSLPPMPTTLFRHAQRWLYASPRNRCSSDCAWDADRLLGACGDWFIHENVEGALLSGIALAGRVLGTMNQRNAAKRNMMADTPIKQLTLFD
jgi:predicted NAD/FAD-dependent oxidoreductase